MRGRLIKCAQRFARKAVYARRALKHARELNVNYYGCPSNGTAVAFLASAGMITLSVCLAFAFLFTGASTVGMIGLGALVIGITVLYVAIDRAEHELARPT